MGIDVTVPLKQLIISFTEIILQSQQYLAEDFIL